MRSERQRIEGAKEGVTAGGRFFRKISRAMSPQNGGGWGSEKSGTIFAKKIEAEEVGDLWGR
jgi:hypothetical protein